ARPPRQLARRAWRRALGHQRLQDLAAQQLGAAPRGEVALAVAAEGREQPVELGHRRLHYGTGTALRTACSVSTMASMGAMASSSGRPARSDRSGTSGPPTMPRKRLSRPISLPSAARLLPTLAASCATLACAQLVIAISPASSSSVA